MNLRRNWQSNRLFYLIVLLFACSGLIALSSLGILSPVEGLVSAPLTALSRIFSGAVLAFNDVPMSMEDINALEQRNAELEQVLVQLQGELTDLREIEQDYQRLADLLGYTQTTDNREYVTADVVGIGQFGLVRSIIINKGTRDGISVGMPVVVELGLVGRVYEVSANFSQVQLVTDLNSFISGRLVTSRAQGTVQGEGLVTGSLEMLYIPLDAQVAEGDLVVTSGLGGNFPSGITIGQVISSRNLEFELTQQAQLASLIDFSTLEFVLVITNFEPVDFSVFENTTEP
ncbi:MAG: rod shape-determining protein MreC [Anaerolineae bacterium]|nr:rod shape-determining protein MreC [Anaerolineae bacterium]